MRKSIPSCESSGEGLVLGKGYEIGKGGNYKARKPKVRRTIKNF
jgi:hypothetical protein